MVIVYILIGIVLIAAAIYWVRLEKKKDQEDVADKVEPDLNGIFSDSAAENADQDDTTTLLSASAPKAIDHDDLSYLPKTAADYSAPESGREAVTEAATEAFHSDATEEEIEMPHYDEKKAEGFLQKISGIFRGKRQDMAIYNDDGNLMRPAAVDTIALILSAAPDQPYTFKEILTVAHELDLRVENGGFIQLLTTTHYGDEAMYSIGHLLGDGTFDENLVRHHLESTTPGLIFFSKIPGPDPDISTIEQLLAGIHHFSSALGGTILDTNQRAMSKDDLIDLFHKINKQDNEEWERAFEAYEQRNR